MEQWGVKKQSSLILYVYATVLQMLFLEPILVSLSAQNNIYIIIMTKGIHQMSYLLVDKERLTLFHTCGNAVVRITILLLHKHWSINVTLASHINMHERNKRHLHLVSVN